ncbi:unnamed protein product [Chironomus riparius]|uniref:Exosome complex component RRP45 n=1 Tax=Chironomus riparius TaxID=315576 RepID=A0A9N9S488_9DIPT|nr:unnamed protein product [Chironomus riparius]
MKDPILSNNERAFVEKAIAEKLRIDKRGLNEFRNLAIFYGKNYGSVIASLGETKVFASVSCEVSTPKTTRPNEGTIFINVEMGSQQNEPCIVVTRILERTIRESNCIDLESLCIVAEEKVWNLRVDISILNNEGNVIDCACIAAVSALAHFRRPDCTASGDGEFTIHKSAEKDLIPIVLHHYPICVNYALFEGKTPIADPTILEERVTNASLILAVNAYKELCSIHLTGVSLTSPYLIQKCSDMAAERAKHIVEYIKDALEQDRIDRENGQAKGFSQSIKLTNIPSNFTDTQEIDQVMDTENDGSGELEEVMADESFEKIDSDTVASTWTKEESDESSDSDVQVIEESPKKKGIINVMEIVDTSSDDEEKETIVLN